MEELTLLLFGGCLAVGAAVMILRKLGAGAYMLSLVMSVLAVGAIVSDDALLGSNQDLILMIVAPFVILLYSLWGMLFGYGKDES